MSNNVVRLLTAACLSTVAFVGVANHESFAADIAPVVKYAPPPRPACAQFGGVYVGGNVGANYYTSDWKDHDNYGGTLSGFPLGAFGSSLGSTEGTNSKAGWNAGGQLGWNWQSGCTVWGVVADFNWANTKASADYQAFPAGAGFGGVFAPATLSVTGEMNWFGTARTRAGVVVDNLLLYVTGGFAFAGFDRTLAYNAPFTPAPVLSRSGLVTDDSTRIGFVIGAGTEWNLGNSWSLGTEFLYMGFQKDEFTHNCSGNSCGVFFPNSAGYRYTFNDSVWVTRVNLNYRFGDYGKSPVIAKY